MMEFKNFHAAQRTLGVMEVLAKIKKEQLGTPAGDGKCSTPEVPSGGNQ